MDTDNNFADKELTEKIIGACFEVSNELGKRVIIELKAVSSLLPEHETQLINYLRASGIHIGLLINFGKTKLEFKRFAY